MADKTETPAGDAPPAEAAPVQKRGKGKLFIILGAVFLLLGGGGAAAYFTLLSPAPAEGEAAAAAAEDEHKPAEAHGLVSFEPFIVNLADTGGRRFLRISVRLLVPEEEEAKEIEEHKVTVERLRASILEILSSQTSEQVASLEGKTALKHQIAERAKPILEPIEVADVLFSDFVVQY
jgi:flagellar FliL protein